MRNLILSALGSAAIVVGWTLPAATLDPVLDPRFESPVMADSGLHPNSVPEGDWAPGEASVPRADAGKMPGVRLAAIGPIGAQVNLDRASVTETVQTPALTILEWALILLGVTLAGAAALISHRGWTL